MYIATDAFADIEEDAAERAAYEREALAEYEAEQLEGPGLTECDECRGTGTAPAETGPGLTGRPLTCLACDGDGHLGREENDMATITYDEGFSREETPGSEPRFFVSKGHGFLSNGTRSMTVMDLGGVINVAGVDVSNPEHLRGLAAHLLDRAECLEARQTPA